MIESGEATKAVKKQSGLSGEEKQARKEQVLTQGKPSITRSIADAITIKTGNIFFLCQPDGDVPLGGGHGYGLYYHDCRYLNGYEFCLAGTDPIVLAGTTGAVGGAIFELTNPQLQISEGEHLPTGEVGIAWKRALDDEQLMLSDTLRFKNYTQKQVDFPITLTFDAHFEDVFAVRGLLSEHPGKLHEPEWKDGHLVFFYEGADKRSRSLTVHFTPQPDETDHKMVCYQIALGPLETKEISVKLEISETWVKGSEPSSGDGQKDSSGPGKQTKSISSEWCKDLPALTSDSLLLNRVLDRALQDLRSLRTSIHGEEFFAAGVPWFATLFGRDSLITAMQMLAMKPEIAAETLRLLANYQARKADTWRDAQPGKILHELRVGELAVLNEIPHTPYYGTVDATPLFLILMAAYADWTGDLDLFTELKDSIELALQWIDQYGDSDGDGYVDYTSVSAKGLINQGWKDSGDAIRNADGGLAQPPIALVEVQGYVYRAKMDLARLYERSGQADQAEKLRQSASALRSRFNRDFWQEDLGIYALALQAHGKPAAVVSSNPGQALWTGIADPEKARKTVERLMADDMFSGWGIRTLSTKEKAYNPIGYHLGTVWPHDNGIIAAGFRRYGFDREAAKLFMGILEAALNFDELRLPELFSGFSRAEYTVPVHYPIACHPQAWAAGSIPFLITTFLGLEPHALDNRLEIHRPILPEFVHSFEIKGLRVGKSTLDLHFHSGPDGKVSVDVQNVKGNLDIQTL